MKRPLTQTTALALILAQIAPPPSIAQVLSENGSVIAPDGSVMCDASVGVVCDPAAYAEAARAMEAAMLAEGRVPYGESGAALPVEVLPVEVLPEAPAEALASPDGAVPQAAAPVVEPVPEGSAPDPVAPALPDPQLGEALEVAPSEAGTVVPAPEALLPEAATIEPAPIEPAPIEPATIEPAPIEPAPIEPAPIEPATIEPAPIEPAPGGAAPSEPAPSLPVPEAQLPEPAPELALPELLAPPVAEPVAGSASEPIQNSALPQTVLEAAAPASPAVLPVDPPPPPAAELVAVPGVEGLALPQSVVADPAAGLRSDTAPLVESTPVPPPAPAPSEFAGLASALAVPAATIAADGAGPAPVLAEPVAPAPAAAAPSLAAPSLAAAPLPLADLPASMPEARVETQAITPALARSSGQEFAAAPQALASGQRSGLSDLEKVGLVALGALVVGAMLHAGSKAEERRVVSNTGDRVVVLRPDGSYQLYKDDETILRRPGSTVRTETYNDGSTRVIVQRADGGQVVTIRDASGRVLRRAQYDRYGRELLLIDDLAVETPVVLQDLPRPRREVVISAKAADAALAAELAALEAEALGRRFSLRQIREIAQVRALARPLEVSPITFASGSAVIEADQARSLSGLGRLMQELLARNPGEVFLIEGHTDAVGHAAMNLTLSDRRAESLALALSEYFAIPPENMVVQGYGEAELRVATSASEARNRRVAVRLITPLLQR